MGIISLIIFKLKYLLLKQKLRIKLEIYREFEIIIWKIVKFI